MGTLAQPFRIQGSSSSSRWLEPALLVATLLTCAVALSPSMPDPDLWGHVQYGRDAIRGGLPATTTYSYTAEGYAWVNHENLAEVLLAWAADTIGPVGMLSVKCLLGVAVIALMLVHAWRRGNAPLSMYVMALLVAVNLSYFWSMRPHLLTSVFYALLVALLSWCFAGWEGECRVPWLARREQRAAEISPLAYSARRLRFLWLAPVLFFLWANAHGGFVAGLCIYAVYLLGRSLEAAIDRGRAASGLIQRFAMMFAAAALATFINPYGPGLHLWLRDDLGPPRPEILEWRMPDMTSRLLLPFCLMLLIWCALLLLSRRSRDLTHLAILVLTLWQALLHQRHISLFAITFGFWMVDHADSVLRRFHIVRDDRASGLAMKPGLKWTFATAFALTYALLGYKLYGRLREMPVDRKEYPVAAFQYIADRNLQGKMVVAFNWAQYALAAFGPPPGAEGGIRVSFDGRLRTSFPQEIIDMNFDFLLGKHQPRCRSPFSPPFDDQRVLEYGQPDLVLIDRQQPHSVNVMFRNLDRWTLLYQDKLAQLWGRTSKYDVPGNPHYIPATARAISEQEQKGSAPWPALPTRAGRSLVGSVQHQGEQNKASTPVPCVAGQLHSRHIAG